MRFFPCTCSSKISVIAAMGVFLAAFFMMCPQLAEAGNTRAIKMKITDREGKQVGLYRESHALVIGVSDYIGGWPKLESVPYEVERVEQALLKQGFHVKKVIDPNSDTLVSAFETFIDDYGYDAHNRLLFFFSGHGYTRKQGTKGYLVPIDAPDPRADEIGFLRKALGMGQILTWSRRIEAKHALFLFDSCFSGTVFTTKALPKYPPHISNFTSRPVRQFISAGSAGEEVPAKSVFTPLVIRALEGKGDIDRDGFVTGTEMGMYLNKEVQGYKTGQHPQYGKIRDPDLDRGDNRFSSDVDIIVDFDDPTFDHYMDLKFRLEEIFERPVDLVVADTLKPRLKPIVEQEIVHA